MRRTTAFIAHELRTQARSLRFRVAAVTYVAVGSLPAVLIHLRRTELDITVGGATYAMEIMSFLPLLTGVIAILLSLDGIGRERASIAWTTVALTDLTNAGYLLRRWIALLAVVVPLTLVPVLVAAGLAVAGAPAGMEPAASWGPWLLHILPLAVCGTALGLGLGTLAGGGMGTFVAAALLLAGVPWLAAKALAPLGYGLGSPLRWLDVNYASVGVNRMGSFGSSDPASTEGFHILFPLVATESGYDLGTTAEQSLADGLLGAALAALALGLAVVRLRRTRPDLPPWSVRPDHPLRSFLKVFSRLREAVTPDPALALADRLMLGLALLLALAAGAAHVARADDYDELAWNQVRTELVPPEPTPRDVLPGAWKVEGRIAADGEVDLRVAGTMRNTGTAPRDRLAFVLNPHLDVAEAAADRGQARTTHVWDRLIVHLDPPLAPGESRELRFRLAGRPAETRIPKRLKPGIYEDGAFGAHQRARFGRDLINFANSLQVPSVSGYRVELKAEDLLPVPRYGPWTREAQFDYVEIAPEVFFPDATVSLSLSVPSGLLLVDSCGGRVHKRSQESRLESRCTMPLPDLSILGGRRYQKLESGGAGVTVAVFPSHRAAGELHLGFLARSSRMLKEAWPGLGGLEGMTILEWPATGIHGRHGSYWFFDQYSALRESPMEVRGRVILLRERNLIRATPLDPEPLAAEIVASRLARRRRLEADQQMFFLQLFRTLALQRLGLGPEGGAVLALDPKDLPAVLQPALSPPQPYWRNRFPALIAALEHRAGREPLRAAVDELTAAADRPATFEEFEAILRRHAREPVDGMLRDFFREGKLPELVLEDVRFHRAGTGWRATGRVRNRRDGEAVCRVVMTASVAPVETRVTVGTGEVASFTLETPDRPQAVFLDPDRECHRLDGGPGQDRAYFKATLRAQGEKVPQEVSR